MPQPCPPPAPARLPAAEPHPLRQVVRRLATGLASGLLLAAASSAQGSGSSESGLVSAMGTGSAGGDSVGLVTGGQLSFIVGQPATGARATSASYAVESGTAWAAFAFSGPMPLVAGVRPGLADKDGGETLSVFGFNFTAAGAGVNNVTFDGVPGFGELAVDNTELQVTTPVGTDPMFFNPLANVDVALSNGNGDFTARDAMSFTPALVAANHAQLDRRFKMRIHGDPATLYLLAFGTSLGIGAPVPPFDGQLELITNLLFLTPTLVPMPDGSGTFEIQMPGQEPLIGFLLEFQAIVLDPTLTSGAWTNRLPVVIQAGN